MPFSFNNKYLVQIILWLYNESNHLFFHIMLYILSVTICNFTALQSRFIYYYCYSYPFFLPCNVGLYIITVILIHFFSALQYRVSCGYLYIISEHTKVVFPVYYCNAQKGQLNAILYKDFNYSYSPFILPDWCIEVIKNENLFAILWYYSFYFVEWNIM